MGNLAAIFTSVCWTISSVLFTSAGRKVGASVLNRLRLSFAMVWIMIMHLLLQGTLFPFDAPLDRWVWLGLSGIIGLVLGDLFLYQAYVSIGPRIATLIMSLSPVMSALLAWWLMGEALRGGQIAGILLTVAGIMLVVFDRTGGLMATTNRRQFGLGLLAAFGGAVGQTIGVLLTKRGLEGDFSSVSGLAIRMLVSTVVIWILTLLARQGGSTILQLKEGKVFRLILLGSIVGPFLGIWGSIIAIQQAPVGIASTLMSLNPIFLLPISALFYKEHIRAQAVIGTLISMGGIVVLFLL
ncbi:MAG: DMT family transporter [Anaerolineae bacterium]|nr:DMT family transporter [Anaerolineae bacterium]